MLKKIFSEINKPMNRLKSILKTDNKKIILIILLISGIALLAISELPEKNEDEKSKPETTEGFDAESYSESLENRLTAIISSINGAGRVKVMVTLASGSEDIYLSDSDSGESYAADGKSSIDKKDEYVIIDDGKSEKGIVVRVVEPEIRGVAVVCDGAENEKVRALIIDFVTALLDINSTAVSVAPMGQ